MMIASVWRIERSSSEATEMRNTMNHINIFFLSMFYDNIQVPISDRWNNLHWAAGVCNYKNWLLAQELVAVTKLLAHC